MKRFEAQWVIPAIGSILSPGALAVAEGRIVAVGSPEEVRQFAQTRPDGPGPVQHLGEGVLFPGLINAHAHLDYTCLRGALLPPRSFSSWLDRVGQIKRTLSDTDFLESLRRGLHEAAASGTTTVCSIESFPQLLPRLSPPRIRVWWFYELSDLRHRHHPDDLIQGSLMFFEHQSGWKGGFGLSPHAPYSASDELFALSQACAMQHSMPWTTHVAESAEEMEMFTQGKGPLFDFLNRLGRDMQDCGRDISPLRHIQDSVHHPPGGILAHLNYLDEKDWHLLDSWGTATAVVHCPSSHRFFGHHPFNYKRLRDTGARIALGTDSGATGGGLDLREELRIFRRTHPDVAATTLWEMVTSIPASFLGQQHALGHLQPGACADFVVFRPPAHLTRESLWDALIEDHQNPMSVWVDGTPVAGVVTG